MKTKLIGICVMSFTLLTGAPAQADTTPDYAQLVEQAHAKYKNLNDGKVANYIPALASYDPKNFAIVLATVDGKIYQAGDVNKVFPIQSISKVFTMGLVMQQSGPETVLEKLGANATGLPFNSGVGLEASKGTLENPMVNIGAMSAVSLVRADNNADRWTKIKSNLDAFANANLAVNEEVFKSEMDTNQHNKALAHLAKSFNRFYSDIDGAVEIYTRQCSVDANTLQLARMGAVLANNGKSPFNGQQLISQQYMPYVLAEMAIAGLYDGSGKWLYQVGIPAKSGVGGGILAVVPGKYSVAVYSPPLDEAGNSVRAQAAIKYIADATQANIFVTPKQNF